MRCLGGSLETIGDDERDVLPIESHLRVAQRNEGFGSGPTDRGHLHVANAQRFLRGIDRQHARGACSIGYIYGSDLPCRPYGLHNDSIDHIRQELLDGIARLAVDLQCPLRRENGGRRERAFQSVAPSRLRQLGSTKEEQAEPSRPRRPVSARRAVLAQNQSARSCYASHGHQCPRHNLWRQVNLEPIVFAPSGTLDGQCGRCLTTGSVISLPINACSTLRARQGLVATHRPARCARPGSCDHRLRVRDLLRRWPPRTHRTPGLSPSE